MARGFKSLTTILLLAGIPGFGQIIIPGVGYPGGQYPGGGYPGRRYPQQGPPPNSGQTNNGQTNQNSTTRLEGMLRSIGTNNVIIQGDDQTTNTVTTAGSTKYIGTSGSSAKIGDFQPGDHVKIDVKQDNKNVYHATTMTLMKEGTPDEHSAASLAMDHPTQPLPGSSSDSSSRDTSSSSSSNSASGNSSNSSNSGNRPQLRRAPSSSDDTASSSSSRASNNDDNNDPDRPRLRRAPSSSGDTVSNSNSSSSSSSSDTSASDNDPDRPRYRRAVSGSDDTVRAEITPGDRAPASAAPSSSAASPRNSDDSGPPVLRRSGPASTPSTDSDAVIAAARPSLHADDSNGVTRLPSAPQIGAPADGDSSGNVRSPQRMPATGDDFIDDTREAAFSFNETLPNYVVKQFTTRYATTVARGGKTSWQALDTVTADVIEEDGSEKYKNILVNGKPPREDVEKSGSWSRGEFSSLQLDVLSPLTNADFRGKRATTIVNKAAFRYDFSVEQPNSHWHVEAEGQSYSPAYSGTIWIDKENHRVLRIELQAQSMPRTFPLDQVESAVDYDYVLIGEGKYLLPVHSEALSCAHGGNNCTRNVIEFRNYKKFTADTSITFDADNK